MQGVIERSKRAAAAGLGHGGLPSLVLCRVARAPVSYAGRSRSERDETPGCIIAQIQQFSPVQRGESEGTVKRAGLKSAPTYWHTNNSRIHGASLLSLPRSSE